MSTLARKSKIIAGIERLKKDVVDLQILDYSALYKIYTNEFAINNPISPAEQMAYIMNISYGIMYYHEYMASLSQVMYIANEIRELLEEYNSNRLNLNVEQSVTMGNQFVKLLEQLTDINGRSYFFNAPVFSGYNATFNLVEDIITINYESGSNVAYKKIGVDWGMDPTDIFYDLRGSLHPNDLNFNILTINTAISKLNTVIVDVQGVHDKLIILKVSTTHQYEAIIRVLDEYKEHRTDELKNYINNMLRAVELMNIHYRMKFDKLYSHMTLK